MIRYYSSDTGVKIMLILAYLGGAGLVILAARPVI